MCRPYVDRGCYWGPTPHWMHHPGWGCCHPLTQEEERAYLKRWKEELERQLTHIVRRMEELKKEE